MRMFLSFLASTMLMPTTKETRHRLAVGVLHAEMHDGREVVSRPPTRKQSRQQDGRAETWCTHPVWTEQAVINDWLIDPVPIMRVAWIDLPELGKQWPTSSCNP